MRVLIISILFFAFSISCLGQVLTFTDLELKRFLLTEPCVDTNKDGIGNISLDLNNDAEIQLSEVLSVQSLAIRTDDYNILDITELNWFTNLEHFYLSGNPSSSQNIKLAIDNLTYIRASDFAIESLDLSELPNLQSIYLHSLNLKYLNLKNGSLAEEAFSLFYTRVDSVICVDSIQGELNLNGHLGPNGKIITDCGSALSAPEFPQLKYDIYPNPASSILHVNVNTNHDSISYRIINSKGGLMQEGIIRNNQLNIETLPKGGYVIQLLLENRWVSNQFIKL